MHLNKTITLKKGISWEDDCFTKNYFFYTVFVFEDYTVENKY